MDNKAETSSFFPRLLQRLPRGGLDARGPQLPKGSDDEKNNLPVGVEVADDDLMHSREDILNEIEDRYFDADFDAVEYELSKVDVDTTNISEALSMIAEKRSTALDAVSDTLSMNILRDYEKFNKALTCISKVQEVVETALVHAKISREELAMASVEVRHGVTVWKNAQKKKNIALVLAVLKKLQSAIRMLDDVREDLEGEKYSRSIESCSMCGDMLASESIPAGIIASGIVANEANKILCDIAEQMYLSLSSMVGHFDSSRYASLMEGYSILTDASKIIGAAEVSPAQEIIAAFTAAPLEKVKKVVLGIVYRLGIVSDAAEASLVDLLAHIQADTFKLCLQQVLKVEYDIIDSFIKLEQWHLDARQLEYFKKSDHAMTMLDSICVALPRARRLVWNEVSGSLMTVLQSVKLGHGENFVSVSKWIHAFLRIGEDFSGESPEMLHSMLCQQSIRFFKRHHHVNCIEALYTVLEKETYGVVDVKLPWLSDKGYTGKDNVSGHPSLEECRATMATLFENDSDLGDISGADQLLEVKNLFFQHSVTIGDGSQVSTTNSFWRLIKWIMEYLSLMRDLPSAAPSIAIGLMELLDLFLLHVYATFVGVIPASLHSWYASQRLIEYIDYARTKSLVRYSKAFEAWYPASPIVSMLALEKTSKLAATKFNSSSSKVSNSGNLYGFVERTVISASLKELSSFLEQVRQMLEKGTFAELPLASEIKRLTQHLSIAAFVAEELADLLYRTCCSLLLPLSWLPDAVSNGTYLANDPPSTPAAWTEKFRRQLELLSAQLDSVKDARVDAISSLWSFVFPAVSHSIVDGLSQVKKCTLEGRAAMSLDLQAVAKILTKTCPPIISQSDHEAQDMISQPREAAIRFIDDYIKGFYVPIEELHTWATSHESYTHGQIIALARCIQESMKRGDTSSLAEFERQLQTTQ